MSRVAIIGAGLGGLSSGIRLAQKGHKVTIFEKHGMPGGYVAGFWRKGFYFESGTLSFEFSNQVFKDMKQLGVYDKLEFAPQPTRFLSKEYDFCPQSYQDFKDAIVAAFPEEKESLGKYFQAVNGMYRPMKPLVTAGTSGPSMLWAATALGLQYLKYRKVTITEFTARYFDQGSELFRFFKSFGYPDMGVWILGGAYASILHDYWGVKSGMQSWADILAARFKELGGELVLKTPVEKIFIQNGRAAGVVANGLKYEAAWVISGCDYKKTFLNLLEDRSAIPFELRQKIEKTQVSEGIVTVYLGLNISNDQLKKHMKLPHVFCFDEQPGANIHNSEDPDFFDKSSVSLYSPSMHDARLAPEGKSSLMLQMTAPYRWMGNWGGGDKEKYQQLKERVKKIMIGKASFVIPDLAKMIEFSEAATPLTYERYTGNTDGATSAWSWNPNNKFYKGMGTYVKTPVKGLLIGSCWATQIGGVPGALSAGKECAKRIR